MIKIIKKFKYTKDHEWIDFNDNTAIVGISDFAQNELGDIVFVELPNIGDSFSQNDIFGTIEAIKTVADLYIPVSGEIIDVNEELNACPELINTNPYSKGWIVKIKLDDKSEINALLDNDAYQKIIN